MMNGMIQLWSRPWHAVQRHVAHGLATDLALLIRAPQPAPRLPHAVPPATSWIARGLARRTSIA